MSFEAMAWASKQKTGSAGSKLVLLMLANHTNGQTGQCNPRHKALAEVCEITVETLKKHIATLEASGLLRIIPQFAEGVQLPNQYILNIEGGGGNFSTTDTKFSMGGGVEKSPPNNQEDKPVKETVKPSSCPAQVPDAHKAKKWGTDDDHKAARFIFGKVRLVDQTAKEPNWSAWANEIRLMREQDKRTHREICELFEWANQDQFWRANVLSPGKLRDKWTQLQAKRGSKEQHGRPSFDETQTRDYGESGLI